jgi:phosphopantothenoylcysteine decarboxylase/phosphopantothenate--cysteine ligase
LSGSPVILAGLETHASDNAMPHIDLARWADLVLIAPATANTLAKLALGLADDILSSTLLAYTGPVAVAPAMNRSMWENTATQRHISDLAQRNIRILGPDMGSQACGDEGPGRMLEPEQIISLLQTLFGSDALTSKRVLITAGPTQEPIDPVRYLSNRSSGKMGFALAHAALQHGARVCLISGPVHLECDPRILRIDIETAQQMHAAVQQLIADQDILIACAAVADYRPAQYQSHKIKKSPISDELRLTTNPDIVKAAKQSAPQVFAVGFCAETENLPINAKAKLLDKDLDMIVANEVGGDADIGMDSDYNAVDVFWRDGQKSCPRARKTEIADFLIRLIGQISNPSAASPTNVHYIENQTN